MHDKPLVIFVGDSPSERNYSKRVAFAGAGCFSLLVEWIHHINPHYYLCLNSHTSQDLQDIQTLSKAGFKVVALGKEASRRLSVVDIEHYKMPHPSGLNRILNDKEYVAKKLDDCKNWVHNENNNKPDSV
jgi:hypothetical protein